MNMIIEVEVILSSVYPSFPYTSVLDESDDQQALSVRVKE